MYILSSYHPSKSFTMIREHLNEILTAATKAPQNLKLNCINVLKLLKKHFTAN